MSVQSHKPPHTTNIALPCLRVLQAGPWALADANLTVLDNPRVLLHMKICNGMCDICLFALTNGGSVQARGSECYNGHRVGKVSKSTVFVILPANLPMGQCDHPSIPLTYNHRQRRLELGQWNIPNHPQLRRCVLAPPWPPSIKTPPFACYLVLRS